MALEGGQEWLWLSMNGMLGLPLALAAVVFSREIIRSGVALAVGFRVFEIRWGAGRPLGQASIGSIDLAIAPIPLGGSTIARSGLARRHKLAAAAISIAPTIVQLAWLIARPGVGSVVTGARNVAQIEQIVHATEIDLSAEAVARLDAATDEVKQLMGTNPDMWRTESRLR